MKALKIACLPPLLTMISSSAKSSPLSRLNLRCDRLLQRRRAVLRRIFGVAAPAPPDSAASIAWGGVAKSGSPIASEIDVDCPPRAARARLIVIATLAATCDPAEPLRREPGISASPSQKRWMRRAGLAQALGVGRVADAEMAGIAERRAMHRGDAFLVQQRGDEASSSVICVAARLVLPMQPCIAGKT